MVKTVLFCTFTLLGAFIGAGFISGKEIAIFFLNGGNLILNVYIAFILFAILIFGILFVGKGCKNFYALNKSIYGLFGKIISIVFGLTSIISASAMLSGTESIFNEFFNTNLSIPIFAIIMLIVSILTAFFGIKILKIVSIILVPIMLLGMVLILVFANTTINTSNNSIKAIPNVYLYVTMNIWFSLPLIIELGKSANKRGLLFISLLTSFILATLILLIGLAISGNDRAINSSMPLLYLASDNKIKMIIYVIITLLAIFTTLSSSLYSMRIIFIKSDHVMQKMAILGGIILLISLCGFSIIVEYLYPLIGLLGLIYLCVLFVKIKLNGNLYKNNKILQK